MSLFGALQVSGNALFAQQVGLQVTSNNIANANTPGYIRQRVIYTPGPTQLVGNLPMGLGVHVDSIVQTSDRFLSTRLRTATSDLTGAETEENTFTQLEAIIAELGDTDLSTRFTEFFSSINDVLNQPEDVSVRNLAVLRGESLAEAFQRLDDRVRVVRENVNDEIIAASDDINRLLREIAELNVNIVSTEGGYTDGSDAVGLRDKREVALKSLAELVGVTVAEQSTGSVTVFANGNFLVFEGEYRTVEVTHSSDRGQSVAAISIADTEAPLTAASGRLAGLYSSRDDILGGFLDSTDDLARSLIFEFNKIHASGQGLSGYAELTSEFAVADEDAALDQAGLSYTPINGSFQLLMRHKETGITKTYDLTIGLNGLATDTSLTDLAAALDAVEGLSADITPERHLALAADSDLLEFSFAHDTSGVLAALGLNTFFQGDGSRTMAVSDPLSSDASKLAASQGGIGADTENALLMAAFPDSPLDGADGLTFSRQYERIVAGVTQDASVTKAVTEGFRVFQRTLEGQYLGITGVNIDEEAVKMITIQRAFQASARMIAAVNQMLEILVNL